MKKIYFLVLCFIIIGSQNSFSQSKAEKNKSKSEILSKANVQLMALDSVAYAYAPNEPTIYQYDSYGRLILMKDVFSKYVYTYDNNENLINTLYYIWDYDSNFFRQHENIDFLYDNNGNKISEIMSIFIDSVWLFNQKTLSEYTNNLLTKEENYFFDLDSNYWIYYGKTDYLYNESNLITKIETYYKNEGIEELGSKTEYLYDNNNNPVHIQNEYYNSEGELSYGSKTFNSYNSNNLLTQILMENYNAYQDSLWKPSMKQTLTYNPNNLMVSRNNFMHNATDGFVLHSIDSLYYDNNNNQTLINTYTNYNQEMDCTQKYINLFDYNYTSDDVLQFSDKLGHMKPEFFDNYNNMLTNIIYSSGFPDDLNSWSDDSTYLYYSMKNIIVSLGEGISFNGKDFLLYPNPTNTEAKLVVEGLNQDLDILIYDIKGRLVENIKSSPINERVELVINTRNLRKGTYIINLRSGKYSNSKKLIVN